MAPNDRVVLIPAGKTCQNLMANQKKTFTSIFNVCYLPQNGIEVSTQHFIDHQHAGRIRITATQSGGAGIVAPRAICAALTRALVLASRFRFFSFFMRRSAASFSVDISASSATSLPSSPSSSAASGFASGSGTTALAWRSFRTCSRLHSSKILVSADSDCEGIRSQAGN